MNFFRALVAREEFSERALSLTSHALRLNPHNYNLWSFRKKILRNIKYDPQREFCWSEEIIRENPKNFYAWEHRRAVANMNLSFCDAETELNLTEDVLELDIVPKNYHAWQHRQWTIQTHKFSNFGLLSNEMKFTSKLLEKDVRNNSAWNQRFFILKLRGKTDFVLVKQEFFNVIDKIKAVMNNESAWNYLRGIIDVFGNVKKLPQYQNFKDFIDKEFYEENNHNRQLIGFLIDAKIEMILDFYESSEIVQTQKVFALCNLMADKYDIMKKSYWKFVYKQFCYDKIKRRHESNESGGAKTDQSWKAKIGKKSEGNEIENDAEELESPCVDTNNSKQPKFKKFEKPSRAAGIGTDLLFDLMNKYNN